MYWLFGGVSEQDVLAATGVAVAAVDPQRAQLWSQKPDMNA